MRSAENVENFIKKVRLKASAQMHKRILNDALEAQKKSRKTKSAKLEPNIWRIIMKSPITKLAAAAVIIIPVLLLITIFRTSTPAYGFEQTVAAMQGKRSFHIQTYYDSPTKLHDEFWAEFDEHSKVIRVRQLDQWRKENWPTEVWWENQVEHKYKPGYRGPDLRQSGILVICKTRHHVDKNKLEEFDPETMVEEAYRDVEKGKATIKVHDSLTEDGNLVVEVTMVNGPYHRVLLVDPETKLVLRWDQYQSGEQDDEGNDLYTDYNKGIEVLEYNQPLDPKLFEPNVPADTIIIDQISGPVGMAEGSLHNEEVAYEVARQGLEAWAADDYGTAGLLFGGAPPEFFKQRTYLKPVADIVFADFRHVEWYGPTFIVKCSYVAEQGGELKTIKVTLRVVRTELGQPARWFINPTSVTLWLKEWGIE